MLEPWHYYRAQPQCNSYPLFPLHLAFTLLPFLYYQSLLAFSTSRILCFGLFLPDRVDEVVPRTPYVMTPEYLDWVIKTYRVITWLLAVTNRH